MSISTIPAAGGSYYLTPLPYTPPPTSTSSITKLATGATVTTIRGSSGDVLAVSTAAAAQQTPAPSYHFAGQDKSSTIYATA